MTRPRFKAPLMTAMVVTLMLAAPASAALSPDWQSFAAAPLTGSPLVAAGADGDLYGLFLPNQLRRYDPVSNSWSTMPSLPYGYRASLASIPGGDVYLIGGGQLAPTATNDAFNPSTRVWTARADMPVALDSPAVAGMGGRLYVFGGETASSPACGVSEQCFSDTTLVYDPTTDSWSSAAAPPITPIYMTAAVAMPDGWIYLPGVGEAYQPSTDTWRLTAGAPFGDNFSFAPTADGDIVALHLDLVTNLVTVSVYSPAGDRWTTGTAQSVPVNASAASALVNGRVYVIGMSGQLNRENRAFLDVTAPSGSLQINAGATTTDTPSVTVTSTASDSSGVDAIRLANTSSTSSGMLTDGTTYPYPGPLTWQLDAAVDGPKTVWAQWRDAFGHWSTPISDTITLDRPPAITQLPTPSLPASGTITDTAAPVVETWAATDLTPILRYDLYQSTDRHAFTSVLLANATTDKRKLSFGHSYTFRVDASDSTNQTGTGTASPFTLSSTQQTAATLTGNWTTNTSSAYAAGSDVSTSQAGASASFTFTGQAVSLISSTGADHGKMRIYVDGILTKTIDTSHSTTVTHRAVFAQTWPSVATHTLKITCAGTAGRPRIDVDAFITIH